LIVHGVDGCIGISFTAVTNEPETATAAGTSVFHHDLGEQRWILSLAGFIFNAES
jgi:hypothetical protein